ncbi:DNA-processing protein DprA [Pararhodobacter zhoushanensis]|uniref:DNA-processing protein DprA n=1 Tax=Pararhodobacter zhoushanensis TaxID=2479545 RepID=A0ABT3H3T7_9RHOB|nr:DNA-processing protein DprA [Pararhodobacter zhoushanensis]MCW1934442.1 DNA-processing protein DprA [Pararhodobacter zhoushanensis]
MDGTPLSSPTPFTPPTTEEDRLSWLRLIRSRRVGPSTFQRLMGEHGSAQAALAALPGIARAAGIDDYTAHPLDAAQAELDQGQRKGARLLFLGAPDYPLPLAALTDPPPVLWARGRGAVLGRPAVAIVGARNASSLGGRMARKLAEGLGYHGFVVVSGLARGIDTTAHGGALKTGTIAVMAGGVDVIYPAENEMLAASIADQGLLVSEQPIGLSPQARHFPRRNRLIAGLSRAVIVVEAAEGSGSLITARDALDQGRELLAVPGHPMDPRAAGCNLLIRDGATLVRDTADVLAALEGSLERDPPTPAPQTRTGPPAHTWPDTLTLHRLILDRLGPSPVAEDQLLRDLDLPAQAVAPALLFLELDGRVQRQPGGMLARR